MARDYGRVRTQFWGDEKVRELAPMQRYLALYVLLSPHSNAIGCFRLPSAYICEDTGLSDADITDIFTALEASGLARRPKASFVWIPNYLRHNPPENPNVWRKCVKELLALPRDLGCIRTIAKALLDGLADKRMKTISDDERAALEPLANGIETVSKPLPETLTTISIPLLVAETTVSKGLPPLPNLTRPDLTEPSLEAKASNGAGAPTKAADPWKEVYDFGKDLLGHSAGGIITNLRKTFDDKPRKVLAKLQDAAEQREPIPWINAFLWKFGPPGLENIGQMDAT